MLKKTWHNQQKREHRMRSRRNFLAGIAVFATLPMFSAAALAQKVELRLAHVNQPTIESHKVAVEVAERIAKRSEGRITIKVFPGGMLGTTTDMLEQASQGEPIITFTDAAYLSSFGVPEMGVVGGPFIVENNEEAERLAFSPLMKGWYDKLAEKAKIRVLALNWFDGARHMIGSKPYPTPADLKGVKVRVPPVPTWQKTFEPLGAIPTTVEAAETYSALSQGVVNAGESPLTGLRANRWYEVVKDITLTGHFNLFTGWVMSDAAYNALSPSDRAMLLEEFRTGGQELSKRSTDMNDQIRKEFEAKGVNFHNADVPAYRKATASFYTSFPQWPAGLLEQVRAAASGQ